MRSETEQMERDILRVYRCACGQERPDIAEFMLAALEKGTALGLAAEVHALRKLDFETQSVEDAARIVPVETPIAIEFNGIGFAVMMATPTDLEDFVAGFAMAEGLARRGEIDAIDLHETGGGWVARANLPASSLPRIMERARTRVSESSCGICGIDSVAAALAPIEPVQAKPVVDPAAIHKALSSMRSHQRLGEATGAAHAGRLRRAVCARIRAVPAVALQ